LERRSLVFSHDDVFQQRRQHPDHDSHPDPHAIPAAVQTPRQLPFLFAGAMVATASSAPIGVSNLANLIAMRIVGLDLETYALYMFVPSLAGIGCIAGLLFVIFRGDIPREIPASVHAPHPGPHGPARRSPEDTEKPAESLPAHPPGKKAKNPPVHPLKFGPADAVPPEAGHLGLIRLTIGIVV